MSEPNTAPPAFCEQRRPSDVLSVRVSRVPEATIARSTPSPPTTSFALPLVSALSGWSSVMSDLRKLLQGIQRSACLRVQGMCGAARQSVIESDDTQESMENV